MSGNEAKKSGFRPYKRFLLSLGGLTSVAESFFVLFGYAYLKTVLPPYGAALVAVGAAAAALALVPLMHSTVNRVRSLALGRYHGVLVLSSLVAPASIAFLFNIDSEGGAVYRVLSAALALFLLFLSVQTFSYAVHSITVRVHDTAGQTRLGYLMNALGVAVVLGVSLPYFTFDTGASLGRIAFVLAGLLVLAGLGVYFSTFTLIPKLIRTEPAVFGVRDDYRRFFVRPFPVAACYLGRYFFTAALLAAAVYAAAFYRDVLGLSGQTFCFTAAVAAVGGIAARCIRTASSGAVRTAAAAGSVTAIAATAVVLLLPLFVSASVFVYAGFAAAFAAGVGYGLISDAQKGYMKAALALTGTSRGTHKCMTGMLTCGAAGTAVAVAGITDSIYLASEDFRPAAGVFLAVLAVFLVLGVLFSGKGLAAARLYGRPEPAGEAVYA